jgi:ABC-type lipoprotein release transport system permease subunit
MKPLSAIKYYKNNARKFIAVLSIIILSVMLLYIVNMLIASTTRMTYRTYVEPQKYYSSIAAKSNVLNSELIDKVLSFGQYSEKVIPWVFRNTSFENTLGSGVGCKVFTVKQEDMKLLMSKMNLSVIKGRLPKPGTNEIILHRLVAANKGVGIGDRVGSKVQKNEVLPGDEIVVGLLDGESIVCFDSLEYWMKENGVTKDDYSLGIILVHGKSTALEIERLMKNINSSGLDLRTLSLVKSQFNKDMEGVKTILSIIGITLIMIVSICTSFIFYIHFLYRRSEFGIFSAMGYSFQEIIKRIFYEMIFLNIVGLAFGILVSVSIGSLLNLFVFMPKGQYLLLISPEYFLIISCIPLFSVLFSIIPVWRMMKNIDAISIVEGIN